MFEVRNKGNKKFKSVVIGRGTVKTVFVFLVALGIFSALFGCIKLLSCFWGQKFYEYCFKTNVLYLSTLDKTAEAESGYKVSERLSLAMFRQIPIFYASGAPQPEAKEVFNQKNEDKISTKAPDNISIGAGSVAEHTNSSVNLDIKNETAYEIDKDVLIEQYGKIELKSNKKPQILIVHTHGSESYTQSKKYNYSQSDYARCQDINYNVVRVGTELYNELTKRGFNVIHDKSINNYPSYNNSYNKTLEKIEKHLKENPTIKCVFDVHRDAIMYDDNTKLKLTKTVNGEKAAQLMIVCGSDASGLYNPNWQKNLGFALKIQKEMESIAPGLMRPINLRKERFNMHKTGGSLIFEFGTHGNTLDEALATVKYLAEGIEKVLKN